MEIGVVHQERLRKPFQLPIGVVVESISVTFLPRTPRSRMTAVAGGPVELSFAWSSSISSSVPLRRTFGRSRRCRPREAVAAHSIPCTPVAALLLGADDVVEAWARRRRRRAQPRAGALLEVDGDRGAGGAAARAAPARTRARRAERLMSGLLRCQGPGAGVRGGEGCDEAEREGTRPEGRARALVEGRALGAAHAAGEPLGAAEAALGDDVAAGVDERRVARRGGAHQEAAALDGAQARLGELLARGLRRSVNQ